jgi:hypothetical protein
LIEEKHMGLVLNLKKKPIIVEEKAKKISKPSLDKAKVIPFKKKKIEEDDDEEETEAPKKKRAKKGEGKVKPASPPAVMTKKVLAEIARCDAAERGVEEAEETLQRQLADLGKVLKTEDGEPARTFEHPEKGPFSLMLRADKYFWRPKPTGYQGKKKSKLKSDEDDSDTPKKKSATKMKSHSEKSEKVLSKKVAGKKKVARG